MSYAAGPRTRESLFQSAIDSPWMIHEPELYTYLSDLREHEKINSVLDDTGQFFGLFRELSFEKSMAEQMRIEGTTAVLDVVGVTGPKWNWVSAILGATTLDILSANFKQAMQDGNVNQIVFRIDSPGGKARGNDEMSQQIYDARGSKPIIAFADGMMASAAYYIGSSADRVVSSPSSVSGSIGSIMVHMEASKFLDEKGIKFTPIFFGERKSDGNPYEQLSEGARKNFQQYVDDSGMQFVQAVARNRNMTAQEVRSEYGDGAIFYANRALEVSLIDEISTLAEIIGQKTTQVQGSEDMAENAVTTEQFADFQKQIADQINGQQKTNESISTALTNILGRLDQTEKKDEATARAAKIAELCKMSGLPELASKYIEDEKMSVADISEELIGKMCTDRKPSKGDAGSDDADLETKYRQEYEEHRDLHETLGVSIDQYIEQRLIEDGKKPEPKLSHAHAWK